MTKYKKYYEKKQRKKTEKNLNNIMKVTSKCYKMALDWYRELSDEEKSKIKKYPKSWYWNLSEEDP